MGTSAQDGRVLASRGGALVLVLAVLAGASSGAEAKLTEKQKAERRQQLAAGVSLKCTNGWVPVYGKVKQVQSFKAQGTSIGRIGFRAARSMEFPGDNLSIQLRDPKTKAILALYKFRDYNWGKHTVTRYFKSYTFPIGPVKIKRGKSYEVVFSAPRAEKGFVWMINCFYRDTCKSGRQYREEDGKKVKGAKLDLVLEVSDAQGESVARTIPGDAVLKSKEHYGVSYEEARQIIKKRRQPRGEPKARPPKGDPPPALPVARSRMKLKEALARAARDGKVTATWTDKDDTELAWISVSKKFLLLYDAREGSLTGFSEFLKAVGRKQVSVNGMAFAADRVWVATDAGAFVYRRREKAWAQLAINLDFKLLDAHVEKVVKVGESVVFSVRKRGRYSLDLETNKWSKL